jgi:hypothetical protein
MSNTEYRIYLMKRALARPDQELHGFRGRYEAVLKRLEARLLPVIVK